MSICTLVLDRINTDAYPVLHIRTVCHRREFCCNSAEILLYRVRESSIAARFRRYMVNPKYREDKAAQVAALFLSLRGGSMSKIKLIKLLYIIEREALIKWRRPVIFDRYVSMNKGPVVSTTLNIINGDERESTGPWDEAISRPDENYRVRLISDPGTGKLSDAEEELIKDVYRRYGNMNRWRLCEHTHGFPEWTDPQNSSIPIKYEDILAGAGKTDIEIAAIVEEIENIALMDEYFGQ